MEIKLARGGGGAGAIIRWGREKQPARGTDTKERFRIKLEGREKGREGKEKGGGEVSLSLSFSPSHDISRISYNLQCYGDFMYILAELRSPALRSII